MRRALEVLRGGYKPGLRGARGEGYRGRCTRGLYEDEQSLHTEDQNQENYVSNQNAVKLRGVRQEANFSSDEFL